MEYLLTAADNLVLDKVYATLFPLSLPDATNGTTGALLSSLPRDNDFRINLSFFVLVSLGGWIFYFIFASLSYFIFYDKEQMKHPRFLKNQIKLEIISASSAVPGFTLLTLPIFWAEVKGYSKLYDDPAEYGYIYLAVSAAIFLFFTDMCIYWIHRFEHYPAVYKWIHKPHHKWIVPTPFASHAFHPVDGFLQSLPYHIFPFIFPLHKALYLVLFVLVNMWTIMIHDGNYLLRSSIINSAAHHTVHHLYFNYNYGQYFTLWDRIGGSHRQPSDEQYNAGLRNDRNIWQKQAKDSDSIDARTDIKKNN